MSGGREWKGAAEMREGLRAFVDAACTCELGAPGISDGRLHGPSCAIVVGAMQRERERLAHGRCLTCGLPLLAVDEEAGRLHCVRHVPMQAGE